MKYQLPTKDILLIQAFVTREAHDFTPPKKEEWITELTKKIQDSIENSTTARIYKIKSLGNAGCATRTLESDINNTEAWKTKTPTKLEIVLCACGHLDHTAFTKEEAY